MTCPRLFEAEAMRDGRLVGAEQASFERHLAACEDCRREVRALGALGDALREDRENENPTDELHARRERTRLLEAFDRSLVGEEPSPARRWPGYAAAAAVVVGAVALVLLWPTRPRPIVVVEADEIAIWTTRTEAEREAIRLERGSLRIQVHRKPGDRALVVLLPDGEIEDEGTTFTVNTDHDHTSWVAVEEGRVVLRLRGAPPVTIGPGGTWSDAPRPPPTVAPSASAPEPLPSSPPPTASSPALPRPSPATSASPVPDSASDDFRAAMAALDSGDNARAAAAFSDFARRHPADERAEDAAYLRVLALQRNGETDAMRRAATAYLERYPAGFRRAEVERLAR